MVAGTTRRRTRVALDVGPLHGPLTGVGTAVQGLSNALAVMPDGPLVTPYLTSFRARPSPGTRRLPLPAALAVRCWGRFDRPRADRWLGQVEVIHGTNYVVPPSRLPRLVSVYDCWFLRHPERVHPDVRRASAVLRRAVATGAVVHASSHATADAVRELLAADRVEVLPLGAPPRPSPPVSTARPIPELHGHPFVLALGTMEQRKNLPRLVAAFGLAAADVADLRLVLAGGEGDDVEAVHDAITALPRHLTDRVLLTGRVDDPTKSWLLHHAAVLAYPSLDEGFGFPLLEAMSVGSPVVASDAGSIPEVAGDAALIVSAADVDALAEALVLAITDEAERQRLVTAGYARVAAHDWATTAERFADLYAALAMEGSGS
jgi:glycosyltransferase involved in cell wall biosynthesis